MALGMNIALNSIFLLFFFRTLSNGSPALASSLTAYFNFGCCSMSVPQALRAVGRAGLASVALRKMARLRRGDGGGGLRGAGVCRISAKRATSSAQAGLLAAMIAASVGGLFRLGMAAAMRGAVGSVSLAAAQRTAA